MSVIFGALGPRDDRLLDRMGATLSHRGSLAPVTAHTPHGMLAWRGSATRAGEGIHRDGDWAIALAGTLLQRPARSGPGQAGLLSGLLPDLLADWRARGTHMLAELRGGFVMAILEPGRLTLVRDGAGVRSLYHARFGDHLLFAAEPKALLAVPGFPRRLRPGGLAQYLSFSFSPGAATMLEGIHALPPGHALTFGADHPEGRAVNWFPFEQTRARDLPGAPHADAPHAEDRDAEAKWIALIGRMMHDAVAERLPSDEPVGVFLSGGLDSSLVTAEVARQSPRRIRSWAIHFGRDCPHELDFARAVADMHGTKHEEVLIRGRGLLSSLRRIIWHMDDPIGDPITAPNFLLAAHAAQEVRQVFNGEGGDPLFGGPKNYAMLMHHWYGGVDHGPGFRERAYLASYRRAYEAIEDLLTPEARAAVDPERDLEGILRPFFERDMPASFLNKLMAINIRLKGAHLILPKVERMYGASGLTPLMPLYDERLIRLSFAMPPTLKLRHGDEKVALKRAYADRLPRSVIERPKSGMRVPVHYWFQGELKRYARHILSPRELRRAGLFDPARVKDLLAYRGDGPGRYGLRIWMLLTFEIWRRLVIEGESV